MSGACFRSRDAGGRASAIFPIRSPSLLKTFSPPQSGDASAGVKEPKGLWRPSSPPCACGSPMVHSPEARRSPISQASSHGMGCMPFSWMRCGVMSAWRCMPCQDRPSKWSRPSSSLNCLVGLLADPSRLDRGGERLEVGVGRQVGKIVFAMIACACLQSRRLAEAKGRPSRHCPRSGAPCSPFSLARRHIDVHIAGEPSQDASNQSAKVVLIGLDCRGPDAVDRRLRHFPMHRLGRQIPINLRRGQAQSPSGGPAGTPHKPRNASTP